MGAMKRTAMETLLSYSGSERTVTNSHTATASTTDGHVKREGGSAVPQNDIVCIRTFIA